VKYEHYKTATSADLKGGLLLFLAGVFLFVAAYGAFSQASIYRYLERVGIETPVRFEGSIELHRRVRGGLGLVIESHGYLVYPCSYLPDGACMEQASTPKASAIAGTHLPIGFDRKVIIVEAYIDGVQWMSKQQFIERLKEARTSALYLTWCAFPGVGLGGILYFRRKSKTTLPN
jgi:hypothetical protein